MLKPNTFISSVSFKTGSYFSYQADGGGSSSAVYMQEAEISALKEVVIKKAAEFGIDLGQNVVIKEARRKEGFRERQQLDFSFSRFEDFAAFEILLASGNLKIHDKQLTPEEKIFPDRNFSGELISSDGEYLIGLNLTRRLNFREAELRLEQRYDYSVKPARKVLLCPSTITYLRLFLAANKGLLHEESNAKTLPKLILPAKYAKLAELEVVKDSNDVEFRTELAVNDAAQQIGGRGLLLGIRKAITGIAGPFRSAAPTP